MDAIREGKATIPNPADGGVFYNRVQEFNRDISIVAIDALGETTGRKLCVAELLAASGLRSIRYALEASSVQRVVANDISPRAVASITENAKLNGVEHMVEVSQKDANLCIQGWSGTPPDVIDIDPFGTPAPFVEAAVSGVLSGGMICMTATDTAVLCGVHPWKSFVRYGGVSANTPFCHEVALRLLLNCLSTVAGRHGRAITPLLSLSIDFYLRLFVRVDESSSLAAKAVLNHGSFAYCSFCALYAVQPFGRQKEAKIVRADPALVTNCVECGGRMQVAGPVWIGPLHSTEFIDRMDAINEVRALATRTRISGYLHVAKNEPVAPFYYRLSKLTSRFGITQPPLADILETLNLHGAQAALSHAVSDGIKFGGDVHVLFELLRSLVERTDKKTDGGDSDQKAVLRREPTTHIDLVKGKRDKKSRRFPDQREVNWGPGSLPKMPKKADNK